MLTRNISAIRVRLLHRTVKDLLESKPIWKQILDATKHDSYKPEEYWANGYLWALKTLDPRSVKPDQAWSIFTLCLEFALRLEEKHDSVQVQYLDEVGRVFTDMRQQFEVELFYYFKMESFLDIAAAFNLAGYISVKAEIMTQQELDHA
jgi:hypothetical protein